MESTFKIWRRNRTIISETLDQYSEEQLVKIPTGFSNNLLWNAGHVIAVQQKLLYKTTGLKIHVTDDFFDRYNTGSKPSIVVDKTEIFLIKELLQSTIGFTEHDFENIKNAHFKAVTTSTGFQLDTVLEAFEFNNYHEALHLGLMMNVKKFV